MKKILSFAIIILFFVNTFGQSDTVEIIILHTNDMHSKIDNFSKFASFVNDYKEKNENVFVFSGGDLFTGNPIVDQHEFKGLPIIDLMNKIPYDISCLGNHEFDYGQEQLNNLIEIAQFPFICANINISDQAILTKKDAYTRIITKDSISIGVIGLVQTGKNGFPSSNPLNFNGISFNDPIAQLKKLETYKDSSNILIILSHLGIEKDIQLAEKYNFIDIIIGAHSHTKLYSGQFVDEILITQAGSYMNYAGVLSLKILNGELISKSDTMISLRDYNNSDPEIQDLIESYNNNPKFDQILASAEKDITGKDELGSLITDAMQDTLKTDISFVNNGGLRIHNIPQGSITLKQVYELSPFNNSFVIFDLKPRQLKKLIKYTFKFHNNNELQVNGLTYDLYLNDNKLKKVILKDPKGKKLLNKNYTVAVNDYMASAYNLKFFKNGIKTDIIDSECLTNYLKKMKSVNYKGVKRINMINLE